MTRTLLSLLIFWNALSIQAQTFWQRAVTNYSRHDYLSGNQNWNISQHTNGWMYFANNKGLLEYDGVYWSTYPLKNDAKAKAVKAGHNKIFVGGLGQFGFFAPDSQGILRYHSLSDRLKSRDVVNIWNISTIGNRVYYQSDDGVFCLVGSHMSYVPCPHGISYSNVVYGKLYAAGNGKVSLLVGQHFQDLQGMTALAGSKIVSLLPYKGNVLMVTADRGLYLYDGFKAIPFQTAATALILPSQLTCAAVNNEHLALGTIQNGVILLNLRNGKADKISIAQGLQNKTVLALNLDHEHNLWVGLDNGIDYISLNSHIFFLNSKQSSIGAGYASMYYDGKLYLGTNQGLYVSREPKDFNEAVNTDFVPGTGSQVLSLQTYDDKLFCGGRNFFVQIDHGRITQYPLRGVWNIQPYNGQKDVLLLGTYWGLYVMRKTAGTWKISHKVKDQGISAKSMLVEPSTGAVWVANKEKGLYRLTLSSDLRKVIRQKWFNSKALPAGNNICICMIDHQIVVASRQGLFSYNYTKDSLEPYTLSRLGAQCRQPFTYIWQDQTRNIWYVSQGILRVLRYNASQRRYDHHEDESYLANNLIEDFENISSINGHRYFVGTENGFAMLNLQANYHQRSMPTLQVRYLSLSGVHDSLVYTRTFVPSGKPLTIDYNHNSVKIEYSASNYDKSLTAMYSYKLEGTKKEPWSSYSTDHTKEYTDLPEGDYTFSVRLLTANGTKAVTSQLTFTVLPPWYRTWWAYSIYLILIVALAVYLFKRYKIHQYKLIMDKEQELMRQKEKFDEENNRKNQQIETLENEKIRLELQSKSDELVRSRMNVVRKNEMLQEIKKTAVNISNSINEDNLSNIRRKVVRLIGQIDTNMEHDDDMEAFQTSFDAVHHDFLTTLGKQFPELTHKDKMLCVYLRINLISKEIAPLMNISVRGVEISRYRLRKKLNLAEGKSLTDFLQHITESESE